MANAARLAERCFALARSTTFAGERETAIARGMAIAEKNGLDLDAFDIPGRVKTKRRRPGEGIADSYVRPERVEMPFDSGRSFYQPGDRAPEHYSREELAAVLRRYRASVAEGDFRYARATSSVDEMMAQAADAGSDFAAAYEAGAFDRKMRAKPAREQQCERWPDLAAVVSFLFSRGVPVYDLGVDVDDDCRWYVPSREGNLTDRQLRDLADEVAG